MKRRVRERGARRRWLRLPKRPNRRRARWMLMVLVPLAACVVAGYFYVLSGRFVETENAYLKADKVQMAADVGGRIVAVPVQENQTVQAGDVLFRIDPKPFRIMVARARAGLAQARSDILTLKASYREKQEEVKLARLNAEYAQQELDRQLALAARKLTPESEVDRRRHELNVAQQRIVTLQQEVARLRASLGGDPDIPVERHPAYRAAKATLERAMLDLAHTEVTAPFDGVASNVPDLGTYVAPGEPVMSLVARTGVWIKANFKETQLTYLRPNQPVTIHVDTYPDRAWSGHVDSISQATGAEFSVLPPQNATGNWVKVVQRIPVRIALEPVAPDAPPLRAGMSVTVEVDTGYHSTGPEFLAPAIGWMRDLIGPAYAESGARQ